MYNNTERYGFNNSDKIFYSHTSYVDARGSHLIYSMLEQTKITGRGYYAKTTGRKVCLFRRP